MPDDVEQALAEQWDEVPAPLCLCGHPLADHWSIWTGDRPPYRGCMGGAEDERWCVCRQFREPQP